MIPRVSKYIIPVCLLTLFLIWGCEHSSDDIPTGVPINIPALLASGWENFENADFDQAILDFEEAASRNALEIEAYLGLGWSYMRDGQYNNAISNVYNVSSMINLGVITEQSEIDKYMAESNACLVGAYQGLYPNDINYYAPIVIENVDATLEIDSDFYFTHDSTVDRTALLVAKSDAYYVLSQFTDALYTISEENDSLLQSLPQVNDQSILVETLYDSTTVLGYARLTVPDVQLVDVLKVTDDEITNSSGNYVEYTVAGFEQAGGQITFYGIPIPQMDDYFLVTYYHTTNYVEFLAELRNIIDSFR